MNASRPEADTEYSRAHGASGPVERPSAGLPARLRRALAGAVGLGAAALVAAELSPLLSIRTVAARPRLVRQVATGPHHAWALLPIAGLSLLLALALVAGRPGDGGARGARSARSISAAVALLGVAALVVALAVDLPDVHATGLVGSPATGLQTAQAQAAVGLYLETLGAVVLLATGAAGVALTPRGGPARRTARPPRSAS